MRSYKFFFLIFFWASFLACSQPYEINQSSVASILNTLSSDEMKGRQATSPEIRLAADFITSQFEDIGLGTFDSLDGYQQEFQLHMLKAVDTKLSINGTEIPSDHYFALLDEEQFSFTQDDLEITYINADDNYRAKFNEYRSSDKDLIVLVDTEHKSTFLRYEAYFSRYTRKMVLGKAANIIFVLSDEKANSLQVDFKNSINSQSLSNVIGVIEGNREDEVVLFSAHYDHIGTIMPVDSDSIANGANDNASGVTAVLELARHYKSLGTPERTLIFVTFTAEEMGGYGSRYFSEQLDPDQIVAMFNIEMIGKPAVEGPNTAWITGFDRSSFGELLQKSTEGSEYTFYPDPYPQQNLFYRSDNATLARLGVPAHTISTTPIDVDKDYHQVTDEFDTINLSHLTNTIKAIAHAADGIVSGKDTPTRVDTSQLD